jgi:hypothetical protein
MQLMLLNVDKTAVVNVWVKFCMVNCTDIVLCNDNCLIGIIYVLCNKCCYMPR